MILRRSFLRKDCGMFLRDLRDGRYDPEIEKLD